MRYTFPSPTEVVEMAMLQVDDKYQYSLENKDNRVHGWISNDSAPTGFWQITPSDEFRSGGPPKQILNSHVGPTTLAVSFFFFF